MGTYTPGITNNPTSYTEPADGDDEDAVSVDVMLEGLADKIAFVQSGNTGQLLHTRQCKYRPPHCFNLAPDSATVIWVDPYGPIYRSRNNTATGDRFIIPLDLADGALIIDMAFQTLGYGSNNPTGKAQYQMTRTASNGSTVKDAITAITNDAHTYGGGGNWLTNPNVITSLVANATTPIKTVDNRFWNYWLEVVPSWDAGGSHMDWFAFLIDINSVGGVRLV